MNREFIEQYIRQHCSADDYTCTIDESDSHETRFAQNGITQHLAGPKVRIELSVSFGAKRGKSLINQDDEESLAKLIKAVEENAHLAPEDPEHVPSVGPAELPEVQNCSDATQALTPEQMVNIVQKSIDKAKAMDATVSGMCEKHYSTNYMFTKNGFTAVDNRTTFGHSMTLKKGEVETKVSYEAKDFAAFNLDDEFARLASQAEALAHQKPFDAQKIAVILRPPALNELMWYMNWMMNRRQSDEGLTPFTGMLDKKCFGENFSLYSTIMNPEILIPRFNMLGLPSKETSWVERGVLKNMPADRYWAQKVGCEAQFPFNMYIPGEDSSEEQMMKMVPRGLIINRFWYIRPVDMKRGELTGMTRDGVLFFENGIVKHAVNNLRFNEIPHETTQRILALGTSQLSSAYAVVPPILVQDFNFVDKTSF
ncbi:MAG: metallopeptidase TldD-related protein [Candidatus Cloacimonadaceae bacterium]|jgi:predicted Zn-dependent protease|nr:metallopeptidase TldD-related protein [Candidatus Cloacimonadaceae bacterium]